MAFEARGQQSSLSSGGLAVRMPEPGSGGGSGTIGAQYSGGLGPSCPASLGQPADSIGVGYAAMTEVARQQGLSLIEVLVALVIMAVLSLMTWGGAG